VDSVWAFLSPPALLLQLAWNAAVLTSVQLTVRLIKAYALRPTLLAALLLTGVTVPLTIAYHRWLRPDLGWLVLAMLITGLVGALLAARVLRFRRRRGIVVAGIGVGLLAAPWGAFLVPGA
jgi:putative effector of murein hydrolase